MKAPQTLRNDLPASVVVFFVARLEGLFCLLLVVLLRVWEGLVLVLRALDGRALVNTGIGRSLLCVGNWLPGRRPERAVRAL